MERAPTPSAPQANEKAPDALDLELDAIDAEDIMSASAEELDDSDPEVYNYGGIAQEGPIAYSEEVVEPEPAPEDDIETDDTPARAEAKIVLEGSQRIDQMVLESADWVVQKGEKITHKIGDKKFALQDKLKRRKIESVTKKRDRYGRKSQAAILGRRRDKFANKSRVESIRLEYLEKAHKDLNISHEAKTQAGGTRDKVRNGREEQLRHRIHEMLKVEKGYYDKVGAEERPLDKDGNPASFYDMVGQGRKNRRLAKKGSKNKEVDSAHKSMLRELIGESSTVQGLEALGRKGFNSKIMNIPIVRDTVESAAMGLIARFEEAVESEKRGADTKGNYNLVA